MAREEMIGSANKNHAGRLRGFRIKGLDETLEMRSCGVLIIFSLDQ